MKQEVHLGYFFDPRGVSEAKKAASEGLHVVGPDGEPCTGPAVKPQKTPEKRAAKKIAKLPRRERKYSQEIRDLRESLEKTLRSRKLLTVCLALFALSQLGLLYAVNVAKSSNELEIKRLKKEIHDLTYVSSYLLKKAKGKAVAAATVATPKEVRHETLTVTVDRANLRAAPSIESKVLSKVTKGNSLILIGREGEWVSVLTDKGEMAWAKSELFS